MTVVQRREARGKITRANSGDEVVLNAKKDREGDNGNTVRSTPSTKKGTKAPRKVSASNKEHQNKSPGQTTKDLEEKKANK